MSSILVVESSPSLARYYEAYLQKEGYEVVLSRHGEEALEVMSEFRPNVVLFDMSLPGVDGTEIIQSSKASGVNANFVFMGSRGSDEQLAELKRLGAVDYLEKPFSCESLIEVVSSAMPSNEIMELVQDGYTDHGFCDFIGLSTKMIGVYGVINAAARSKASVFITGESGTGKEVCAHSVHLQSDRRHREFVAINCAAIPRELMESEIFGHVKGAFTGAHSSREGAAVRANGGTLFLDEIGEMDMDLQSKLLRFIQTGAVQKVGSNTTEQVDVRFICATNRDPLKSVREGKFREDLYYRLNVIPVALPPLRERHGDIMLMANSFLLKFSKEEQKLFESFSPKAEDILESYDWPGNIRQLQNVIRNIVVLNDARIVGVDMLPPPLNTLGEDEEILRPLDEEYLMSDDSWTDVYQNRKVRDMEKANTAALSVIKQMLHDKEHNNGPDSEDEIVELWEVEKNTIERAISICGNNIPKAAKKLGVSASTIYRKRQQWKDSGLLQ